MIALIVFSQLFIADSLFEHGAYDLAAVEYERVFFFYPGMQGDPAKRVPFAISLVKSNDPSGLEELEGVVRDFPELDDQDRISVARCYMKMGYHYTAADLLSPTAEYRLLGYAMLLDERYAEARDLFAVKGDTALAGEVKRYLTGPRKSVLKASLFSLVVPGLGQTYAGGARRGLLDFALTAGSVCLLYDAFHDKRYVDAGLIFSFLFNRFYIGSISNAQRQAMAYNEQVRNKWLSEVEAKYFQGFRN